MISIIVGVSSVLGGIVISYIMNLAPGGTIVILSIAILLGTIGAKSIAKSIRYRSSYAQAKIFGTDYIVQY